MQGYKYLKKLKAGAHRQLCTLLCAVVCLCMCVCVCVHAGGCACMCAYRWVCRHVCVHENQVKNLCVHIFAVPFPGTSCDASLAQTPPPQDYTDLLLNTEQLALARMNSHCCGVLTCSLGNLCSLSSSAAMGTSSLSAKSRQVLRSISCVSGKLARLLNTRMRDCSCTAPLHPEMGLLH